MDILGAAPFAAPGIVKYYGMMAEKFSYVWLKSELLIPKKLIFYITNVHH